MFGIGWQELLVIFIVFLIFVGPRKLPEVARSLGKALREFVRAKEEVRRTLEREILEQGDEGSAGKNYLEISLDSEENKTD